MFNSATASILLEGANNVSILDNTFNQTGSFSVLSYYPQSNNVVIANNTIQFQCNSQMALTLGGITNSKIINNQATVGLHGYFDGFLRLVGSDVTLGWGPVSNIQVSGNKCNNCGPFQGSAIYVEAASPTTSSLVKNVQILNNMVSQTVTPGVGAQTSASSGLSILGVAGAAANAITGIVISGNSFTGTGVYGIYADCTTNLQILKNSITNCAGTGIGLGPNCGGALAITSNQLTNTGYDTASDAKIYKISTNAVIQAEAPATGKTSIASIAFQKNKYTGSKNNLNYNIYCAVSQSKAKVTDSGNTNNAQLPDYLAP